MEAYDHGFNCYWRIENFPLCKFRDSFTLQSQLFQVPMLQNSTWNLELRYSYFNNKFQLFLTNDARNEDEFYLRMWILTRVGWMTRSKKVYCGINPWTEKGSRELKDYPYSEESLQDYIVDGCFTLRCHMYDCYNRAKPEQCVMTSRMVSDYKIFHKSLLCFASLKPNDLLNFSNSVISRCCSPCRAKKIKTRCIQTQRTDVINMFNDSENLQQQFKEKKFCYVTLRTASRDFAVHKALLCARSPVFNAMFEQRMSENDSNIVNIDDVDADTLSSLLQFLHLELVDDLKWNAAANLYYAADKYQIELLKDESRRHLVNNLSVQTICDAFILADLHQDKELQEIAQDYLCVNPKLVLHSPEWKELLFNKTALAHSILCRFADGLII